MHVSDSRSSLSSSALYRLVYVSTARIGLDDSDVEAILEASRRNNAAHHVTGLLAYNGANFMQLIEGPTDAVLALYERLGRDDRHFGLVKISGEPVETRVCGDWAMMLSRAQHAGSDGEVLLGETRYAGQNRLDGLPDALGHMFKSFNSLG